MDSYSTIPRHDSTSWFGQYALSHEKSLAEKVESTFIDFYEKHMLCEKSRKTWGVISIFDSIFMILIKRRSGNDSSNLKVKFEYPLSADSGMQLY